MQHERVAFVLGPGSGHSGERHSVAVTVVLPKALTEPDDGDALTLLQRYYGSAERGFAPAGGAAFDSWDSAGTRGQDADWFTADDLVAVTFLNVRVQAPAARRLLVDDRDRFADLLTALGPDRDLVDIDSPLADDWVGWDVMRALRELPDIGATIASKLLARKRPRLRPIWDSVVVAVMNTHDLQWEPLRSALRADECALHRRLLRLRDQAGLGEHISALRILDVIAWREGKDRGF